MRPILDDQTIQIEVTSACHVGCSNCTRLTGHYKNFFMDLDMVRQACKSLVGLPPTCLVGVMGGEPLLHPEFVDICRIVREYFPPEQLGLWSCLPSGYEHYREVIVNTFANVFFNDQTRPDILHSPILISSDHLVKTGKAPDWFRWYRIHHCWIQNTWSASINPRGAFFCEVAAALSMALKLGEGWPVEEGWWLKQPNDYIEQMDMYCRLCGAAMPLMRRESVDGRDDISEDMLKRMQQTSPKLKAGKYVLYNGDDCAIDTRPVATYKDQQYRDQIAMRYGMFLTVNERQYNQPHLVPGWEGGEA